MNPHTPSSAPRLRPPVPPSRSRAFAGGAALLSMALLLGVSGCHPGDDRLWPSIRPEPRQSAGSGASGAPSPFFRLLPENVWELAGALSLLLGGGGLTYAYWRFPGLRDQFRNLRDLAERLHERRDRSTADLAHMARSLRELEQELMLLKQEFLRRPSYPAVTPRRPLTFSRNLGADPLSPPPPVPPPPLAGPAAAPVPSAASPVPDDFLPAAAASADVAPPQIPTRAEVPDPPQQVPPPLRLSPDLLVPPEPEPEPEPEAPGPAGMPFRARSLDTALADDLGPLPVEASVSVLPERGGFESVVSAPLQPDAWEPPPPPTLEALIDAINGRGITPIQGVTCVELDIAPPPEEETVPLIPLATRLRMVASGGRFLLVMVDGDAWVFPTIETLDRFVDDQPDEGIFHYLPNSTDRPHLTHPAMLREVGGLWEVTDPGEILVPTT